MCKKHYVAAIKILFALAFAHSAFGMEKELSLGQLMVNAIIADDVIQLKEVLEDGSISVDKMMRFHDRKESLTPLQYAAIANSVKCGALLLEKGAKADVNSKTVDYCVAIAALNNNIAFLEMLKSKNINLDKPNAFGNTPLHSAIQRDKADSVDFLLSSDVDRQAVKLKGLPFMLPLLHLAAFYGAEHVTALLIEKFKYSVREKIYIGGEFFLTPNDMAVMGGHWKVCQVLKDKGANPLSHHPLMKILVYHSEN